MSQKFFCSPTIKSSGFTPLMHLVIKKRILTFEDIEPFLEIINDKNDKGWTSLMIACKNSSTKSSIETVKLLLKHGAEVNIQDRIYGFTALMFASESSNIDSSIDTVKVLLENGADINVQSTDGWTALMLASRYSNKDSSIETVKLLLEHGADPNIWLDNEWTAMKLAACYAYEFSSIKTVKLLLENGADIKNCEGYSYMIMPLLFEIVKMKQSRINDLENQIYYSPGNPGAIEAHEHFKMMNAKN